ncbi:diguanylate cyclase (GGDEF) domain-containing protein [Actinokineospora alba]|uniref:Diguanylate cyclase (GGDEF) domain-containing protein n=1 Tax=Actinokineospora alba TaxID=504798 RepID=A0A1H0Q6A3_9PSEU|nr:diguanylate cyclase [Actinokineospora alba]TDP66086.1 diguanylate cyclase (GGDEF)-like protein [Actinokineospora alba]SDI58418.1 diguanylate cyclase (GGDEF) domain-containing protein [Actinokineospora alba]SDP12565.1 diguanylate cyclase (GGDEF) domain-containing protein [Actinokineospora alba]
MSAVHLAAPLVPDSGWDDLVAELPYGLVLHDEHGSVVVANASAAELLDLPPHHLRAGTNPPDWRLCDDSGSPVPSMPELARQIGRAGSSTTMPFVVTRVNTPYRRLWADIHPVTHRGRGMTLMVIRPVESEPVRCLLDPTTGLPHRALLFDRIEQSLVRARIHGTRTTLVLADLRGLGKVNRELGFDRGDELLALLADRLRSGLRADQTVARYTGGTFAVVTDHSSGTGEHLAARIREVAAGAACIGEQEIEPELRTGWSTSGGDGTVHRLVSQAETRLRES